MLRLQFHTLPLLLLSINYADFYNTSGTVTVSPKYGQVAAGKDVSLTAKPSDKHSVFYKWEITGLDTEGLDLSAATLKFKSPGTNDVVATAVFVKDKFSLRI